MTNNQLLLTNIDPEEFYTRVADMVAQRLSNATKSEQPPQPKGDLLFPSLKHAADYYGVCYQTLSNNLDKIPHLTIGRTIKIYKNDLENAIRTHGIMKKGDRKSVV